MSSPEDRYREMLVKRMDEMLVEMGEHFDAVQILGTRVCDDGNTERVVRGCGNWYARQGVAREFLAMEEAQVTAYEISKVMTSGPEGDEEE